MSLKRCALARAIRNAYNWMTYRRLSQSSISAAMRKPPFGCSGLSMPIEIIPPHISFSPPPSAHLGRMREAQAAAKAGLALNPSFTIRRFRDGAFERQSDLSRATRTLL